MNKNTRALPMKNPIILALDVDTPGASSEIADDLAEIVGGFKLGPRLCLRYGQSFVQEMAQRGPIFLDNKHFDIPSTMEAAVRASSRQGLRVTVHALAGLEALQRMAKWKKSCSSSVLLKF